MNGGAHGLAARAAASLMLALLVSACVGGGDRRPPRRATTPPPPPRPVMPDSAAFRQCAALLNNTGVRYTPLPNEQKGGGCAIIDTVKLLDFGVPTANLGPMTCPLAAKFTAWARYGVMPAARLFLGADLVKIETYGTYSCRNIVGNPGMAGKRSEHAHANAVDVSAFILSDGRRISLEKDWNGTGPERQFLQIIHKSACKRFNTVLSPDYNAAHYNHFHMDMGGRGGFCR